MLVEVLSTIASIVLMLWACATMPTYVQCPKGFWIPDRVTDGVVRCRRSPVGPDGRNARGILVDYSVEPPGEIASQVYCTGGSVPIRGDDGRTVSCQARH